MTGYAYITSGPSGWISVKFPFDEDLKDELMREAGRGNYRWVPECKAWFFRSHLTVMVELTIGDYGYEVINAVRGYANTPRPAPSVDIQQAWRIVLDSLPGELDGRLYHGGVMALHPDRGGDNEALKTLNLAWDRHQLGAA